MQLLETHRETLVRGEGWRIIGFGRVFVAGVVKTGSSTPFPSHFHSLSDPFGPFISMRFVRNRRWKACQEGSGSLL